MSENDKLEKRKRRTRSICILITVLFITVMLIMPLLSIIASSLKEGFSFNIKLDIENPIIRINTAFKGCSSLEKISVLPRIYHN